MTPTLLAQPSDLQTQTIELRVTDPPMTLAIAEGAFRPNPTTVRFARAIQIHPGDVVFDIGTGVGPLAIKAALDGASRVIAVDPVPLHCTLARLNTAQHRVDDRVSVHQGSFFEPFDRDPNLAGVKAQVIIGDVSGIADAAAHALGWYSAGVPAGGPDGADVIVEFLRLAGRYLTPGGRVYFPVAVDLSDSQRVYDEARRRFERVENALQREYVTFPLSPDDLVALRAAYPLGLPSFIKVQAGPRPCWRGQIWVASGPR